MFLPNPGLPRTRSRMPHPIKKLFESTAVEYLILYNFAIIQVDESGLDKRASYAVYTPANNLRFHSVDIIRCFIAAAFPLQRHHNARSGQPALLGQQIQSALADVAKLVRLRCSTRPVIGNEPTCRQPLATTAIARSR